MDEEHNAARAFELGRSIAERRKEFGITQEELAALSGLSARSLGLMEAGRSNPRLSSLLAITQILGLELELTPRAGVGKTA